MPTKSKNSRRTPGVAPKPPAQPLSLRLSVSEQRAEAAYHVLQLLLARLPDREQAYLRAAARAYMTQAGLPEIGAEADLMFGEDVAGRVA